MSTYANISVYIKNNQDEFELVDKFDYQDYEVFAFVAGVRNYYDIEPISPPRGRINKIEKEEHKDFYGFVSSHDNYDYDTSYTWVTNKEIQEHLTKFDQLKPAIFKAYITFDAYIKWDKELLPNCYSRSGPLNGKTAITMAEADRLIKSNKGYRSSLLNLINDNSDKYQYYFAKECSDWKARNARFIKHVKPSKEKYYRKLLKYVDNTNIKCDRVYIETPLTSKMMKDNLEWLFDRIKPYEDKYGEIYLEFEFN